MGYRNPVTSASDLDTRASAAGAGVQISGASATWFDGYGSTASATLQTPPGGGTGGASWVLQGPQRFTAGSALLFNEEELPAGGYIARARVTAEECYIPRAYVTDAITRPNDLGSFSFGANVGNIGFGLEPLTFRRLADGSVRVGACLARTGGLGWANNLPLATVSAGLRPAADVSAAAYFAGGAQTCGLVLRAATGVLGIDVISGAPAASSGLHINFTYWPSAFTG